MTLNRPSRASLLAERLNRFKPAVQAQEDYWSEISRRIEKQKVIPILANAVRNDLIFLPEDDGSQAAGSAPAGDGPAATVDETLAETWAGSIGYPLEDASDLARVALYNRVKSQDTESAKIKYLTFLKNALLTIAKSDPRSAGVVEELEGQVQDLGFADLVQELGYPVFKDPLQQDSLRLLARLPLSIYVTTSYYDFLERAILKEGRTPITQVCFWSGDEAGLRPEHRLPPNFVPGPENPLVYHLFGLECYPQTLVLSEDDYLDFLVAMVQDTDAQNPLIPLYLREALAESSLVLLGYRLRDWDFKVLFRGIISAHSTALRPFGLIIQMKPEVGGIANLADIQNYLKEYFGPAKFMVEWDSADDFIHRIWEEWNLWRKRPD
jgi:hypothetical protein